MSTETGNQRTDKASRVIHAPPKTVYDAFVHPESFVSWLLTAVPEGTLVATICENVPPGIDQHAHESGMRSTLENLAAFVE